MSRNISAKGTSRDAEFEAMIQEVLAEAYEGLTDEQKKKIPKLTAKRTQKMIEPAIMAIADHLVQQVDSEKPFRKWRQQYYGFGFRRRLYRRWKGYVVRYERLIDLCVMSVNTMRDELGDSPKNDEHMGVLIRLHTRALRISNEVLSMALNGYGGAALSRWRSLHETGVTIKAIAELGPKSSAAFMAHDKVESYKAMMDFNNYSKKLKQRKFSTVQLAKAKKARDSVVAIYGKSINDQYGWADLYSPHKISNFRDLEKHYSADLMRPYYRWSSYGVHTNVKTVFTGEQSRALDDAGVLLIGPSDRGFEDALQLSALSLANATISILLLHANYENIIMANAVTKYERKTNEVFAEFFNKNQP